MIMLIRKAIPEDAEAIIKIFNPIIESGLYSVIDGPLTIQEERNYIRQFPARGVFHLAVCPDQNLIVGFQSIEPIASCNAFSHVASIGTFIDLNQRRRGIGTLLSQSTFSAAIQKNFNKIFSYVRADNPASVQFHLRLGFEIVGTARRHARIGNQYVDEIIIEKHL
jgi:L-amino acid N-acyltransferase YncA